MMASNEAFAFATIELFSRAWDELDRLDARDDGRASDVALQADDVRFEVLRLEIVLARDACRSARWCRMLDAPQRLYVRTILEDVLDGLDAASVATASARIERAQNRLLEAILDLCPAPVVEVAGERARKAAQ